MKYTGQAIQCETLDGGLVELRFDLQGDSVNKLNTLTLGELKEAVDQIGKEPGLTGLLVTSGKDVFIVGADVTEFTQAFRRTEEELVTWLLSVDRTLSAIEDLEVPSVVAINGFALGGGFELCLAASYRVMAAKAKVGLPETKLGIFPGWGGTVRLSRVCGADNAIEWIAGGEQFGAADALKVGAVDAVVAPEDLREAALSMLRDAAAGKLDWKARRDEKKAPLKLNRIEAGMVFETSKAFVAGKAGPNYPSPVAAIEAMQKGATKGRDEALEIEAKAFAKVAKTPAAAALVSVFLGDQAVKKIAKTASKGAKPVKQAAVLGAGIMGGGIAYQSAARGTPIVMKDIAPKALEAGMGEAIKLLDREVSRGRSTTAKMAETLSRIRPVLTYGEFSAVDFVVEAVVESEKVKKSVLAEVEGLVPEGAVLASNTSTISITRLAEALKRPEAFCGMHFFNPVPRMPLVEVIRGAKSSDETIATAVAYATAMGKTPVVVNDCAGFLVNRVLFPYFAGFEKLVADGVDYERVDKVMERWGWPMGPALLLDVVGIDTGVHADKVMADAFPDRMGHEGTSAIEAMVAASRLGQKNGKGFYAWEPQKKGPPKKTSDPDAKAIVAGLVKRSATPTDEEIVERMMLPMLLECTRCLDEKVVSTPVEVDIALLYGLGFPPFRGGIFRWADSLGAGALLSAAGRHAGLGPLYAPTAPLRALAASGKGFHGE
ncbi:fatty acid oxidation complex subunit alpha FadB [Acidobacteria bacterium ACD]|nr:MAG: fatty acid oxidation complex subunit alpha FadB [Acidobacteriota bacterium]MDL1950050.1 fatty acid oxidation complex subunit alpha FadB [Acidobacteria bacterium ACD]